MNGMPVVLAALDDYELRHLPSHLAAGNLDDGLHALLALAVTADPGTKNAWFAAKEAIGDGKGYADDIELAARAAARKVIATVAAGHSAVEVGLEIRYALISAALTTMAVNLPGEILVELVRHGRWSAELALTNARRQPDAWARGRALVILSDMVAAAERRSVLEESLGSVAELAPDASDPWHLANERASVLVLLAEKLPPDLIPAAVARAREITDTNGRCSALAALARTADEQETHVLLHEAIGAFDPGAANNVSTYQLLVTNAPDDLLDDIIAVARVISHPYQRSAALMALLDRLPSAARVEFIARVEDEADLAEDQRLELLAKAGRYLSPRQLRALVAAVPAVEWDTRRIKLSAALLPVLPAEDRAAVLEAALSDAESIDPEAGHFAVDVAATLLPCVPEGKSRNALLAIAIEALRRTQDNAKLEALSRLAPLLPPELLDSALEAARGAFGQDEYFWSVEARALLAIGQADSEALEPAELDCIVARARELRSDENREYVLEAVPRPRAAEVARIDQPTGATARQTRLAQTGLAAAGRLIGLSPGMTSRVLTQWRKTENPHSLELLAQPLQLGLGRHAIEVASTGDDQFLIGRLLTQLVPYLGRHDQETVADRILSLEGGAASVFLPEVVDIIPDDRVAAAVERAHLFDDRIECAQILAALMPRLVGSQAERALDDIIGATEPEEDYRDMLAVYAELFYEQFSDRQVERIKRIARSHTSPEKRFDTLIALLPRSNDAHREALIELLWSARRISNFSDRRDRLAKIAPELAAFPRTQLLDLWHQLVPELAARRREALLADIAGLAPIIPVLGGHGGARGAVRAITDVQAWWP